jgi:hypothetical protein
VLSFGPFSALYFMFYETLKGQIVKNDPKTYLKKVLETDSHSKEANMKQDIGFFQSMFCSMMAGAGASLITNPLDMAKLRMQVQRAGKAGGGNVKDFYYKHMFDGVYKIARDEGFLSLYNGTLARILFHMPNVAITMSVLEFMKPRIYNLIDKYTNK